MIGARTQDRGLATRETLAPKRPAGARHFDPAAAGKVLAKKIAGSWLRLRFARPPGPAGARLVLMYHQVVAARPATDHRAGMEITAATLKAHLAELGRHFELVSLARIADPEPSGRPLCALTFDDGWRDNYEVAFPILRQLGVAATIFLPAGLIGTGRHPWFARLWALAAQARDEGKGQAFAAFFARRLPGWGRPGLGEGQLPALVAAMLAVPGTEIEETIGEAFMALGLAERSTRQLLSWEEAACMGRGGVSFGSHGLRHYALPPLPRTEKEAEIGDSLAILRAKGLPVVPFFCFPNGRWDRESLDLLAEAGYRGGVTTDMGCNFGRAEPFLLQRIALHDYIASTPSLLWYRLWQAGLGERGRKA
ncbi:MAG: polysaccharide deacetylase family protein [Desulfobacteraceae bacterium]|nr:polysaccharide deacetylase family protein [Desulfobacteraceae bacterium]